MDELQLDPVGIRPEDCVVARRVVVLSAFAILSLSLYKPVLTQAPEENIHAILAEERLALENESRYTPMACSLERSLVVFDHSVEVGWIRVD